MTGMSSTANTSNESDALQSRVRTCANIFDRIPCTILGDADVPISGLAYRSNCVKPGDAFFCIVGQNSDGHAFAQDAIDRGACALVAERKVYLADATDTTEVIVADSRAALAKAACAFYNDPSSAFELVGVTGTNGKTTTTYLVEHILGTAPSAKMKTGIIGTVGIEIDGVREKSEHTTPESPDLQGIFSKMRACGCEGVAMEVSSHALDLERVTGTHFAVTAFTNLTQDHLDYHHTFDDYFEAKAKLFSDSYPAKRVINVVDGWGEKLLDRCIAVGDCILTCGWSTSRDIFPIKVDYFQNGTEALFSVQGEKVEARYPLVGRFNVENVMVAIACAMHLGIPAHEAAKALESASSVPGRLQRIGAGENSSATDAAPSVFVDYAHTPDALEKAIASVRGIADGGRVIVVFGCGGDRDSSKRPIMGKAALASDFAIVTSDNPRSESPDAIIADILAGMGDEASRFAVIPDRREAIFEAVRRAEAGDCILIAGKGHEDYQIIGNKTIHFDDSQVAKEALDARMD